MHPCCSKDKASLSEHQMLKAEQGMKLSLSNTWFVFDQRSSWKSHHLIFLSLAASKQNIVLIKHINVFMMLLTNNNNKIFIAAHRFCYSTRYLDFLLQPYSNPTWSQNSLLAGAWWQILKIVKMCSFLKKPHLEAPESSNSLVLWCAAWKRLRCM